MITACVTIGQKQVVQNWQFQWDDDGPKLIVATFEDQILAIPIDKSKMYPTREMLEKQLLHTFSGPNRTAPLERVEALGELWESQSVHYLGSLSIMDAVLIGKKPN